MALLNKVYAGLDTDGECRLCEPQVAMLSLWRNDTKRDLEARARHLLSKTYPALRWVWVVGDSADATYEQLLGIVNEVHPWRRVDLLRADSGIIGEDPKTRRRRLGATANIWLERVRADDDYLLVHESDIISPDDVVERMLGHAAAGCCPIAGWPILPIVPGLFVFYDIWAYRKDGRMFSNYPPFHDCYRADELFEVDSFGTCWLFDAADARAGARFGDEAVLTMCADLRNRGRRLWVDPHLVVLQPRELWVPQAVDK